MTLIYGDGGHRSQALAFQKSMDQHCHIEWSAISETTDFVKTLMLVPRLVTYGPKKPVLIFIRFIMIFARALFTKLPNCKNQVYISFGPASSVPVIFALFLRGKKILHVESWSRFDTTSNTTKILRLLNIKIVRQNVTEVSCTSCLYFGCLKK